MGPVSLEWGETSFDNPASHPTTVWQVSLLTEVPSFRGPVGARWFNDDEWSGIETPSWVAWISNRDRSAAVWGMTPEIARSEAIPAVLPAALRRDGLLDGHGAVIAPDPERPDDGLFVTGLSGSGKSSLTVSCALGSGRFLSDDSVAIGFDGDDLRAWPRRPSISLFPQMHRQLIPGIVGRAFDDKVILDGASAFPERWVPSLAIRAVVFLEGGENESSGPVVERTLERTRVAQIEPTASYQRLIMGHPILAVDQGARRSFTVVRRLADLPSFVMVGGRDLLDPSTACARLAAMLPSD